MNDVMNYNIKYNSQSKYQYYLFDLIDLFHIMTILHTMLSINIVTKIRNKHTLPVNLSIVHVTLYFYICVQPVNVIYL